MGWINSKLFCFSFSKILPPLKVHFLGLLSTKNVYWSGWDDGRVKTKISRVWEHTAHWKSSPDRVSWEDAQDLKSSVLTEFSRKHRAKDHGQEEQCQGPSLGSWAALVTSSHCDKAPRGEHSYLGSRFQRIHSWGLCSWAEGFGSSDM